MFDDWCQPKCVLSVKWPDINVRRFCAVSLEEYIIFIPCVCVPVAKQPPKWISGSLGLSLSNIPLSWSVYGKQYLLQISCHFLFSPEKGSHCRCGPSCPPSRICGWTQIRSWGTSERASKEQVLLLFKWMSNITFSLWSMSNHQPCTNKEFACLSSNSTN